MTTERRRSKRVNAPFFVKIGYTTDNDQMKWEENAAKNVSENGLAITTSHSYDIDFFLTLLMRIPTQPTRDWVEASGKVVDCTKIMDNAHLTRIEFIDLNPAVQDAIRRYVEWISKR